MFCSTVNANTTASETESAKPLHKSSPAFEHKLTKLGGKCMASASLLVLVIFLVQFDHIINAKYGYGCLSCKLEE